MRLKYAQLLASEREDTALAVEEYEGILHDDPKNAEAHLGLARGYAALRQRNKALREANLAVEYGAQGEGGRRAAQGPAARARAEFRGVCCAGSCSAENRSRSSMAWRRGVGGRADVGTAVTLRAEVGGEDYWSGGQDAAGGFARADTDFHLDTENDIGLGVGYHTIGERGYVGRAEYSYLGEIMRCSGSAPSARSATTPMLRSRATASWDARSDRRARTGCTCCGATRESAPR